MKFTNRDLKQLEEVHPHIQRVIKTAAKNTKQPFRIIDGARTIEEQRKNVARGASKTMRSRHIPGKNGYSHAIDIAPVVDGKISWDWDFYYPLAKVIKEAAIEEGVVIEWGGDWRSFKDGPHWQLPWSMYPADKPVSIFHEQKENYTSFSKKSFFNSIRPHLNLTTENVEGIDKILNFALERGTPKNWLSYILATIWWETSQRMQPVKEAYWKDEIWRRENLRYYPYYGRGLVQTTWETNYDKIGKLVGKDFVSNPDDLLNWDYAIPSVFVAMENGLYTGKALKDYIDNIDESDSEDYQEYVDARRIINGTDKDDTIAKLSVIFEDALEVSMYELGYEELLIDIKNPDDTEDKEVEVDVEKDKPKVTISSLIVNLIKYLLGNKQ